MISIPETYCMEMTANVHKNLAARVAAAVQLLTAAPTPVAPGPSGRGCMLESDLTFPRQVGALSLMRKEEVSYT